MSPGSGFPFADGQAFSLEDMFLISEGGFSRLEFPHSADEIKAARNTK
jgi:hypothetical protein